jgi:uncharacterized peroxidase-related enzyme
MPHITLSNDQPGIVGLFHFRPETGLPLSELAEVLLRSSNTLSRGERELIAAFVSSRNQCKFCTSSHAAFAGAQLPGGMPLVDRVCEDPEHAPVPAKLKALLRLAGLVQQGGKKVTSADIDGARAAGASDMEIHDAVLIAAAFCMYNRYVDGLAALTPDDPAMYARNAEMIVANGYLASMPGEGVAAR